MDPTPHPAWFTAIQPLAASLRQAYHTALSVLQPEASLRYSESRFLARRTDG